MSMVPSSDQPKQVTAGRAELQPQDPKDDRSRWQRFCDALRRAIGRRPKQLADEFLQAKVDQEKGIARLFNAEAEAKILGAIKEASSAELVGRNG